MPRSPARDAAVAVLALLAACHSSPPTPLPIWDTFRLEYRGRVVPAEKLPRDRDLRSVDPALPVESVATTRAIAMRATLVELPADEVRALLPAWPHKGPRIQGAHIEQQDLARRIDDWRARHLVVAEPLLVCSLDRHATFTDLKQTAFIGELDLKGGADPLFVDPVVDAFEHGLELQLAPRRDAGTDALAIAFDWRCRDRVLPRALGRVREGRLGTIELPMLVDQSVRGEAPAVPGATLLLGAMVGGQPDTIRLLCIDVDDARAAALHKADRVVAAAAPRP